MAVHAPITGAPTRASAFDRRAILAALAATAFAPAVIPAGIATARSAWDAAMAAFLEARDAADHQYDHVLKPLNNELERIAPWPDLRFSGPVARNGTAPQFRFDPENPHQWDDYPAAEVREKHASIRTAWNQYITAVDHLGVRAASADNDLLADAMADREGELLLLQAPDLQALLWKMEHMFAGPDSDPGATGNGYVGPWLDVLLEDARRLLGPVGMH